MVRLPGRGPATDQPSAQAVPAGDTLDAAIGLYRAGMVPLPVRPGSKAPAFTREEPWQEWRWENEDQLRRRMRGKNLGVRCDGLVIVDTDNSEAEAYWAERLGPDLWDRTTAWVSSGGRKTAFRYRGEVAPWSRKARGEQTLEFDICAGSGKQVVVPPSTHPDGSLYRFLRDWSELVELTDEQAELLTRHQLPGQTAEEAEAAGSMGAGSQFTDLLLMPPQERTNNWLTQLCGHLAKREHHYDAYVAQIQAIDTWSVQQGGEAARNQMKTIDSVWRREQAKRQEQADATDTGNLTDGQGGTWLEMENGAKHLWLGAHIETLLVIDDEDKRYYRLRVTGPASPRPKEITVPAWKLNASVERNKILAGLGYEIDPPTGKAPAARLLAYIESQRAECGEAVGYLGWHEGAGFLGDRGMVVEGGERRIAPLPAVISQSAHAYGREGTRESVTELLREIYTYQEPEVAAVAMSWWVMSLLRGRFPVSVFPILHLDAVSESGKTNGFFAFLVALAGNTRGSGTMTYAQLRNQVAAVQNGIVWIDDITNVDDKLRDLLRQAPSQGTLTKTAEDNTTSEAFRLVGSILLSAEGLGSIPREKAMRDRILSLKLPPVTGRQSLKGEWPQWLDIQETLSRHGGQYKDFARMAGTVVSLVHARAGMLDRMREMYQGEAGRHAEKLAILRMGAEILASLLGHRQPIALVEGWINEQEDLGQANYFIREILPRLIREKESSGEVAEYLMEKDGSLYVHPGLCADTWERIAWRKSERDRQLGSEDAIMAELRANGMVAKVERFPGGVRRRYWKLTTEAQITAQARAAMSQQ